MRSFDVVVLGGGSAGEIAAKELAEAGRSVALVERFRVGGTCPYVSCVPSKTMLRSAEVRHDLSRVVELGARAEPIGDDDGEAAYETAAARRDAMSDHRSDSGAAQSAVETGVVLIRGDGRLDADRRLVVHIATGDVTGDAATLEEIGYRDLVITTGSHATTPDIAGLDRLDTWSSDDALSTSERPVSLIVIGGGPVGCELAQLYTRFGSTVTIIEAGAQLLGPEEPKVSAELAGRLRDEGVTVLLKASVESAQRTSAGARLVLADGTHVDGERIIVATGRAPTTAPFADAGLPIGEKGELVTDDHCRIDGEQHLWAAGDVTGTAPFTHTANYQARIVVANLLGHDRVAHYEAIPRAVYTDPPVASVGLSQAKARDAGLDVVVDTEDVGGVVRNSTEGHDGGLLVLVADRAAGVLVGASAIGPRADEWLAEATLAIRARTPLSVLADLVHPFPTYGEIYENPYRRLAERVRT